MSKSLRLSEKWFRRGLWLVAFVFAGFLIGLGGALVGDLPRVERELRLEDYMDPAVAEPVRQKQETARRIAAEAGRNLDQAELELQAAEQASQSARETFANWVATRSATQRPDQDAELVKRTQGLDALKAAEDAARRKAEALRKTALDARQAEQLANEQMGTLESAAQLKLNDEYRRVELRVFGYRLALTLPLLLIAGWLFARRRKSSYWPFVWGFIFFAVFAFFVELVPYLPSYGGYVRYIVGIIATVLIGRYAIVALNRYLERQKLAEQQPDRIRREELSYDTALARLAKSLCPGCERPVELKNAETDFCPHCGIGLFDHCIACNTRKSAFSQFCHACGTAARAAASGESPAVPTASPSA